MSNKVIKITNNNWHKYLDEYGWEKLHLNWIKRLNKSQRNTSKINRRKNSLFGILDCGGSGDCFFSSIIESLNSEREVYDKYDVKMIRKILADSITEEKFPIIIENYRVLKDINEFYDDWDPYKVNTIQELKNELCKEGENFIGDHIILQLFQELFSINIIILSSTQYVQNNYDKSLFKLYNTGIRYCKDKQTIILSYEDMEHFRLIGYLSDSNMITLFNNKTLPYEIFNIINQDLL